jgi:hypothetical protein
LFSIFLEFCFIFDFWFVGYFPNLSWLSAGRLMRKLYAEISSCLTLDQARAASTFKGNITPAGRSYVYNFLTTRAYE